MDAWFEDAPTLGSLALADAAQKLEELGDMNASDMLRAEANREVDGPVAIRGGSGLWPFQNRPWQHTSHAFGYVAGGKGAKRHLIVHAGSIPADTTLRNARIKIALSGMRSAEYPGSGSRRVLFDFYAQNQVPGKTEDLHFNATFRMADKAHAAVLGYPVFVGLTVGNDGVFFKCFTVNVANENDEAFLAFLETDVFRAGLKLTQSVQPAIAQLSTMAYSLTKAVARRRRNVPVQEFYLGLDFSVNGIGARLAEGTYIAVQLSETALALWNWNSWQFNEANGLIVSKDDNKSPIPYNYVMFTVTRYDETK